MYSVCAGQGQNFKEIHTERKGNKVRGKKRRKRVEGDIKMERKLINFSLFEDT
jgi:hypothetical protein